MLGALLPGSSTISQIRQTCALRLMRRRSQRQLVGFGQRGPNGLKLGSTGKHSIAVGRPGQSLMKGRNQIDFGQHQLQAAQLVQKAGSSRCIFFIHGALRTSGDLSEAELEH
jgi:hypothetical protein